MKPFQAKLPRNYQQQTYASPYWIVRYPHQVRARTTTKAILARQPVVLLDYGAGDGHMLFDAIDAGHTGDVVAYEPVEQFERQIVDEAQRRGLTSRMTIITRRSELRGPFDFIVCLGVLEHRPLPERASFYELCAAELAPDGAVLVDVPVEVGPTLLVKHAARMLLKGRDPEYGWRELARYTFGARMFDPGRYDPTDDRTWINSHKGFDYRLLDREIRDVGFRVTQRVSTPMRWLPAPLLNQERFITFTRP